MSLVCEIWYEVFRSEFSEIKLVLVSSYILVSIAIGTRKSFSVDDGGEVGNGKVYIK